MSPRRTARRARLFAAVSILAAVAIGVTVWAATRSPGPTGPPSVLDVGGAPTCSGDPSGRCSAPGTVRWMRALAGPYTLQDDSGVLWPRLSPSTARQMLRDHPQPDPTSEATAADGMLIYQQGGLVEAIDPTSGMPRWRTELAQRPDLLNVLGIPPVVAGNRVAVTATSPGGAARIWELDLRSGRVDASIPLGAGRAVVTLDRTGVVVGLDEVADRVEKLDWAKGTRVWRASFSSTGHFGPALIGNTLYDVNSAGTELERIDLGTGGVRAPLPMPAGLRGAGVQLYQAPWSGGTGGTAVESDLLMASTAKETARIDPATGRVLWAVKGAFDSTGGLVTAEPRTSPLLGAYTVLSGSNGPDRMTMLDLTSGKPVWTATLGTSLDEKYLGAEDLDEEHLSTLIYDSLIVTDQLRTSGPGSRQWARLEGVDPRTGRTAWVGPWMSADFQLLGWSTSGPPVLVAEACAPSGTDLGNRSCGAARIFAVNA